MRRIAFVGVILCAAGFAQAQWAPVSGSPNDIYNTNTGLVGVGTAAPYHAKLDVFATTINGIWGKTTVAGGVGVGGVYSNGSGTGGTGIYGWTDAANSCGIQGYGVNPSAPAYGVYGQANSPLGAALYGYCAAGTGGIGVLSHILNSDGFAVYALGGQNYFQGPTGVGTTAPTAQLDVNGTVRFETVSTSSSGTSLLAVDSSGNVVKQSTGLGNGVQEFTSGTNTWTVPAGVTRVHVQAWGAGGGGYSIGTPAFRGGSGAYVEGFIDVSSLSSLTITVGAGGTITTGGGNTTVSSGGTTFITAGGGGGALGANGSGGTVSVSGLTSYISRPGYSGSYSCVSGGGFTLPAYPGPSQVVSGTYVVSCGSGGATLLSGSSGLVVVEW